MPRSPLYALVWSEVKQHYELLSQGQREHYFRVGDELVFSRWLEEHTSFAFVGKSGRFSVIKEGRSRGTAYWYLYHKQDRHTRKGYLGPSEKLTLSRLEEQAWQLTGAFAQEPKMSLPSRSEGVLSTRLTPPRLPTSLVERSRLLDDLDAVRAHPLTLVSASAGSGKTTLLAAWAMACRKKQADEGAGQEVAWLSLDELDNDPLHFWASVIAALRHSGAGAPTLGDCALSLLHALESPPLPAILVALLNEVAQLNREVILILDDYHVISDQAIHDSLLYLLDHLPDTLHLVLISRTDPELPLSRFRVRGQLAEVRSSDLRFTGAEAASFLLDGMNLPLTQEDVELLSQRTEGWIAGLQLAALSLRKRDDLSSFVKSFAGSYRYLMDYMQQEVLLRLPGQFQDFLLQTAILTRINAAVCQAVTESPTQKECQEMLEEVERANLFVVPLDEQRQWYRFHDLFRETLLTRLRVSQPELVPLLHRRAARYYEAEGELREAITHALAAEDYAYAASMMEQAAEAFWHSGHAATVHAWVLSLPDTVLRANMHLALGAALRLLHSIHVSTETIHARIHAQVERTITRIEEILLSLSDAYRFDEASFSDAEVALIRRRLRLLRAWIEARAIIKRGDKERLRQLSQEIEALPPDKEQIWNMISLSFTYWLTHTLQHEGAQLLGRLLEARQQLRGTTEHLLKIRVASMLALAYIYNGRLHLAYQECLEAITLLEQTGGRTVVAGYVQFYLCRITYAWNRLEEASDWLQRLLRIASTCCQSDLLIIGQSCLVQLSLARGDRATAQEALQRLLVLTKQEGFGYHAPWVTVAQVQWWLAEANLAEASEWATQTTFLEDEFESFRKWEFLMLMRVYLAQRQYTQVAEMMERWSKHLDRPEDMDTAIHFLALYVVALHHAGRREQATRVAIRLLSLTESEGYIRVYLDAGPLMKQVLLMLLKTARLAANERSTTPPERAEGVLEVPRAYISRLLAAFEKQERSDGKRAFFDRVQESRPQPLRAEAQLEYTESLSPQEEKVLRLLIAGQTYAEMAETLIVSPNTIKTQVSSIYHKLGVNRRAEAIAVAQRLHLF